MRKFKHLTLSDRLRIESLVNACVKVKDIAAVLGFDVSSIYRELKRGRYEHLNSDYTTDIRYSPDIAEQKYQEHLRSKGCDLKIGTDRSYAEYLEYKISAEKYSPAAVLGEIKHENIHFDTSISKTTLYRYIDSGVFLTVTNENLPVKRNKLKKRYRKLRPSRVSSGTSIEKRPECVDSREFFGDWEMDCVVGKLGTRRTLLVLTERKTRYEIVKVMRDKTAASVVRALDSFEREIGARRFRMLFRSVTVDNGCEFSDCKGMESSCFGGKRRTSFYYCHPYSSWERGSNENQNKLIRRHYPKGFDFSKVTASAIRKLQDWINNYPRGIFGFRTSAELFEKEVELLFS